MLNALKKWLPWKEKPQLDQSEGPRIIRVSADYPCVADPDMPFASLNPMQSCFLKEYRPDKHCVVEAGTGTGKSVIAYIASRCCLDMGQFVVLIAPTRELVKSLYKEASGIWGNKIVGLNTGNDKNVAEKFFIVTTPEGYISAVRGHKPWTKAGLLIVDEGHKLFDPNRGGDLDVAITLHTKAGGKSLLMSGTFDNKEAVAAHLDADLFIADYRRTILHVHEIHCPDDMEAKEASKKGPSRRKESFADRSLGPSEASLTPTLSGHVFNRASVRLREMKKLLSKHEGDSILVFVPTKAIGYCLSDSLVAPFHNGDLSDRDRDILIADFREGRIKVMLATDTVAEGVNTPADAVIVFGSRRAGEYFDKSDCAQRFGRAGRGKDEAHVYLLGDRIELFHAKKSTLSKSLPLPIESMILTLLSLKTCSKEEILADMSRTYSVSISDPLKVQAAVERYLHHIRAMNILSEKDSGYSLTKEGSLLARYFISPQMYIGYIKLARKLAESPFSDTEKGFLLLTLLLKVSAYEEIPSRIEKDFQMKLIPLEMDKDVSARKAGVLQHYASKPSAMPPYFAFQLRGVDRWMGMFSDMERYGVHNATPGKLWIQSAMAALKTAAAKADAKKKPAPQMSLV